MTKKKNEQLIDGKSKAEFKSFGNNNILINEMRKVIIDGKQQRPRYNAQYADVGKRNLYVSYESYAAGELPLAILDPHTPIEVRLKYKTLFDVVEKYKGDKKELGKFLDLLTQGNK